MPDFFGAVAASTLDPAAAPPGVNNPACKLSAAHPRPVILITGTFENMVDNWSAMGPVLADNGYCVFSMAHGAPAGNFLQSVGPFVDSANQVAAQIDSVIAGYGGKVKVDLVGHSQGGTLALYIAKVLKYAPKIGGKGRAHEDVSWARPMEYLAGYSAFRLSGRRKRLP
ncbi:hypothetical protein LTV02_37540 [Nocardia yamanashiensis]|uniref:esterase/lipase family protein n=1 Tax=Nocardia yamanashiensis TaxID=209247 RepID=UPI001E5B5C25|nr:alpha/beta hydrolase family protein [Nocardia yamanashiensis]UGT41569.1 hypothetical protein LTV02_37540 [Nocardia yamanashiensis]